MTDDPIAAALRQGGIIDITTTGRTSGQPRRIEIAFFSVDGQVYITGMPGTRAWLANLKADPSMTLHLKHGLTADLPATARIVTDETERRAVATAACTAWNRPGQVEAFVAGSPVIEVVLEGLESVVSEAQDRSARPRPNSTEASAHGSVRQGLARAAARGGRSSGARGSRSRS